MLRQKAQQIFKILSIRLGFRKSLILCLVLSIALYIIYSSSDSWPSLKSVSKHQNAIKYDNVWKDIKHISLPNLIHRQLIIDTSNVLTITPENLTSLISKSKSSSIIVIINYFS